MPNPGLKVGDQAPGFRLTNARGQTIALADLLAQGPVVLTFYRGAWCPYCNLQLRGLAKSLPAIEAAGGRLVAITPQTPDKSLGQVEKDGYPFEILSDLDSQVMRDYGLLFEVPAAVSEVYKRNFKLDLAEYNGAGRYVLPVTATYVIDRKGVVRFAFADTDYRKRAEPAAILEVLRGL
jgi:peroxiredoxin